MTDWTDDVEAKIYDDQYVLIAAAYGTAAANSANYGWGVSGDDDSVSVATKVYLPYGAKVLTSNATNDLPIVINHSWSDYK